jgi:hypothetical protein
LHASSSFSTHTSTSRNCTEQRTYNPFRIRTYENFSRKPFRIRTCKKCRGWGSYAYLAVRSHNASRQRRNQSYSAPAAAISFGARIARDQPLLPHLYRFEVEFSFVLAGANRSRHFGGSCESSAYFGSTSSIRLTWRFRGALRVGRAPGRLRRYRR